MASVFRQHFLSLVVCLRMPRAVHLIAAAAALGMCGALHAGADRVMDTSAGKVALNAVAQGLDTPWALAFLPDGRMVVTERSGALRIVDEQGGVSDPVANVPEVYAQGQGGLLDVALSPDFAEDARIFLSYAEATSSGARTAVARAELDLEGLRLNDVTPIFAQRDAPSGAQHFGSRLVFADDGTLFITTGDRNHERELAQDLGSHLGKILRVHVDGSVPADNPFVDQEGALPEIWSYGHRNVQGAALHPETRVLWNHDHGPRGGDELNIGQAGGNYGWPEITHGREYATGRTIGEGSERDDVIAPTHYWVPTSIAPSGMTFYDGEAFPQWQGSVFIGALRGQKVVRLTLEGDDVVAEETLFAELGSRIRDVRQGPDGALYLLDESEGRILRVAPADD